MRVLLVQAFTALDMEWSTRGLAAHLDDPDVQM